MRVRVIALAPLRRRAGFAFTPEPVELTRADFGGDEIDAIGKLLALAGDPSLRVTLVQADGSEQVLGDDEREALADYVAAQLAREALADSPADPAIAELAERLLGEDETEIPTAGGAGEAGGDPLPPADPAADDQVSTDTAPEDSSPAGAETAAPAAEDAQTETGPSAAPAAGKPAGKARPKAATPRDGD